MHTVATFDLVPFRPKAAYATSVETSVYLTPGRTGRGDGRRLSESLFAALAEEPVHRAYAGIALPNEASVQLHERLGFTPVGVWREVGFKHGRFVDVGWFERPLSLNHIPARQGMRASPSAVGVGAEGVSAVSARAR